MKYKIYYLNLAKQTFFKTQYNKKNLSKNFYILIEMNKN